MAEDVLPFVLRRWGPIPGVSATRDLTGPWDQPGSERTVVLDDGSTARETVLAWERPRRFEYRVDRFSSALGRAINHGVGVWTFEPVDTGAGSQLTWTYTFFDRAGWSRPLLVVFVRTAWARYMEGRADLCVARAIATAG